MDILDLLEPEVIVSSHERPTKGKPSIDFLICWKNKPLEEATWQKVVNITIQFPNFCLEDKASFSRGGIDGNLNPQLGQKVLEAQFLEDRKIDCN